MTSRGPYVAPDHPTPPESQLLRRAKSTVIRRPLKLVPESAAMVSSATPSGTSMNE